MTNLNFNAFSFFVLKFQMSAGVRYNSAFHNVCLHQTTKCEREHEKSLQHKLKQEHEMR